MTESIIEIINKSDELTNRLGEILEKHKCTKNYMCLERTLDELCPVCPLGNTEILECINCKYNTCKYLYTVGGKSFCECEVRIFIQQFLK
ncbi:MAG: hypothetical protein V1779_15320 [bacterium]